MYKLCVALAALLAIAAAKPSLGLGYGSYVAPVAAAYSAPVYSHIAPVAPVAAVAAAPLSYAAAPVAAVAASYPAYSAYSAYSSYPAVAYSDISAPFLWKKK